VFDGVVGVLECLEGGGGAMVLLLIKSM